ncbi:MAG: hypothetical protein A2Z05_05605 [Chloroflexi bacterium RBG_16_60_22]|nr:MAG: hypothetical protein A2Z05_05605 [Chloroflexi bacterium RBG_16_60_22]
MKLEWVLGGVRAVPGLGDTSTLLALLLAGIAREWSRCTLGMLLGFNLTCTNLLNLAIFFSLWFWFTRLALFPFSLIVTIAR